MKLRVLYVGALTLLGMSATCTSCATARTLPPCVEDAPPDGPHVETGGDPVLLAAGDIAEPADLRGAIATSTWLSAHDGHVAMLGDGAQGTGSLDEYLDNYGPTWGRERWRTRPAPGNHDYMTPNAGPYYAYFCTAAGPPFRGYYSYDIGAWHVVVLDSARPEAATDEDSAQGQWLREDLAAHPSRCTLAYWHHPRFSSGTEKDATWMRGAWQALHDAGAELVLNGHTHHYERFAPQDADGRLDDQRGIREIIAGTGGGLFSGIRTTREPNSEVVLQKTFGVLELTLHPASYEWAFHGTDDTVLDRGSDTCH